MGVKGHYSIVAVYPHVNFTYMYSRDVRFLNGLPSTVLIWLSVRTLEKSLINTITDENLSSVLNWCTRTEVPWVSTMGEYDGWVRWVSPMGKYNGWVPWVSTMGEYHGWVPLLTTLVIVSVDRRFLYWWRWSNCVQRPCGENNGIPRCLTFCIWLCINVIMINVGYT